MGLTSRLVEKVFDRGMPLPVELNRMCEELVRLLEEQIAVIKDRGLNDFSKEEWADFDRRRRRVAELEHAIEKLVAARIAAATDS
jgi:hypothetical protein